MRNRALVLASLIMLARHEPISAHHPLSDYNLGETRTIEGTLVELQLSNPHSLLYVDVRGQSAKPERWAIEWLAALSLKRQGVSGATLTAGDHVVVTGYPAHNPADHRIRLRTIRRPRDGWRWTGSFDLLLTDATFSARRGRP